MGSIFRSKRESTIIELEQNINNKTKKREAKIMSKLEFEQHKYLSDNKKESKKNRGGKYRSS